LRISSWLVVVTELPLLFFEDPFEEEAFFEEAPDALRPPLEIGPLARFVELVAFLLPPRDAALAVFVEVLFLVVVFFEEVAAFLEDPAAFFEDAEAFFEEADAFFVEAEAFFVEAEVFLAVVPRDLSLVELFFEEVDAAFFAGAAFLVDPAPEAFFVDDEAFFELAAFLVDAAAFLLPPPRDDNDDSFFMLRELPAFFAPLLDVFDEAFFAPPPREPRFDDDDAPASASRLTSLLKRLPSSSESRSARLFFSNQSKNSSHSISSSVSSPEKPGKSMRRMPGSLPDPVARTAAGCPPRASTHSRISSWSTVGCAVAIDTPPSNSIGERPSVHRRCHLTVVPASPDDATSPAQRRGVGWKPTPHRPLTSWRRAAGFQLLFHTPVVLLRCWLSHRRYRTCRQFRNGNET
jgi:hypothetical protein